MRVTFRAQFSGPTGKLNPSGWKIHQPAPITIEVFRRNKSWVARECDTKEKAELRKLGTAPTHGAMKDLVAENFERYLIPWAMFDTDGRRLDESLIQEDPDGNFQKRLPTHCAAPNQAGMPGNQFRTECGIEVGAAQIRSKRGQNPPDCGECRIAWEKAKEARLKQA